MTERHACFLNADFTIGATFNDELLNIVSMLYTLLSLTAQLVFAMLPLHRAFFLCCYCLRPSPAMLLAAYG